MKGNKTIWILVALTLVSAILMGCGGGAAAPTSAPPTAAPQQPAATQPPAAGGGGDKVQLVIESWRNDDLKIWQDQLIPAFNKKYPNIQVTFQPLPPTEYNAA